MILKKYRMSHLREYQSEWENRILTENLKKECQIVFRGVDMLMRDLKGTSCKLFFLKIPKFPFVVDYLFFFVI